MNDIYPIQEWVEIQAPAIATEIADNVWHENYDFTGEVNDATFKHFDPRDTPKEVLNAISAALGYKAAEILAARYTKLAEGWCESYYRALKRKYEGE